MDAAVAAGDDDEDRFKVRRLSLLSFGVGSAPCVRWAAARLASKLLSLSPLLLLLLVPSDGSSPSRSLFLHLLCQPFEPSFRLVLVIGKN